MTADVVVVTGAAGWLGQNLVRALADRERVRCLVPRADEGPPLALVSPAVEIVVGDVRDPATADALFNGVPTGATVVHAAAIIHPAGRIRDLFDVNVGGTQLVIDRARRAGARRFVHVSSNSPFGTNPHPGHRFTEDSPYDPYLAYGQSKLEAEQLVQRAHGRGDVEGVVVRPPWFYGPFQPERQSMWFRAVRTGRFPLVGDGSQRRSMVFTGNLVHGILRAETSDRAPGGAWWIADAEPYELREILDTVRAACAAEGLQVTGSIRSLPLAAARAAEAVDRLLQRRGRYLQAVHVLGELGHTIACDVSGARAEIGYDPQTTLLDGMRRSVRWCLDRGIAI